MKTVASIHAPEKHPPSVIKAVYQARDLMTADISFHLALKSLARQAGTNEYTLKKGFKAIFKTSVYQYLLSIRMERALKLITETNHKEASIAEQCGYETLSGFVTSFHKYYGQKPGDIRKNAQ
ncbi:AraC family transcriptional regulator [Ferruginibacter paludis]|uniref:helix-turn-helix transcriptional regulator n=1 Tax=Ferruginibacter paludis TaxID=1310417 RepID=UPI0025B4833C|nr:AraC family transcriptional regulator [Ferruginibacter paludis]MDN3654064.1 AraC family transcriptional regulator [Ferruginibacter paludis]